MTLKTISFIFFLFLLVNIANGQNMERVVKVITLVIDSTNSELAVVDSLMPFSIKGKYLVKQIDKELKLSHREKKQLKKSDYSKSGFSLTDNLDGYKLLDTD